MFPVLCESEFCFEFRIELNAVFKPKIQQGSQGKQLGVLQHKIILLISILENNLMQIIVLLMLNKIFGIGFYYLRLFLPIWASILKTQSFNLIPHLTLIKEVGHESVLKLRPLLTFEKKQIPLKLDLYLY